MLLQRSQKDIFRLLSGEITLPRSLTLTLLHIPSPITPASTLRTRLDSPLGLRHRTPTNATPPRAHLSSPATPCAGTRPFVFTREGKDRGWGGWEGGGGGAKRPDLRNHTHLRRKRPLLPAMLQLPNTPPSPPPNPPPDLRPSPVYTTLALHPGDRGTGGGGGLGETSEGRVGQGAISDARQKSYARRNSHRLAAGLGGGGGFGE